MKPNNRYLIAIVVALLAALACSSPSELLPTQTPYPTYTPYPTFTPIPLPTSTPEKNVIFEENDFGSVDSCFGVSSIDGARMFAEDGQYHIKVETPNLYVWSTCEKELRNFIMEVDASMVEGPETGGYGVFIRKDETGGFYTFLISGDGYYTFQGRYPSDNQVFNLLLWSPIREINQGYKTNHLKVVAIGGQFELYVNEVQVGLVREDTLSLGTFGFVVETYNEKDVHISFDNLVITEP